MIVIYDILLKSLLNRWPSYQHVIEMSLIVVDCCLMLLQIKSARWRMVWMPKAGAGHCPRRTTVCGALGSGFRGGSEIYSYTLHTPGWKIRSFEDVFAIGNRWISSDRHVSFLECISSYFFCCVSICIYSLHITFASIIVKWATNYWYVLIDFPFLISLKTVSPKENTQLLALERVAWMGYTWRLISFEAIVLLSESMLESRKN